MVKRLKIGIDIDNVISDSATKYLETFNRKFGTSFAYEQLISQDLSRLETGVELSTVQEFVRTVLDSGEFQLQLLPYTDAIDVITGWSNKGYSLHYITARPTSVRDPTLQWLTRHGFMVPRATLDLIVPGAYENDPAYKADVASRIGIDVMIEDTKANAEAMKTQVLLIDRPWNRGYLPDHVCRVRDWKQIEEIVASK